MNNMIANQPANDQSAANVASTAAMKRCSKCGEYKPATAQFFSRHNRERCGLRSDCKTCAAAYKAEYRKNNRERLCREKAEYRRNNKDKIAQYEKEYRKNNKEMIAERRLGDRYKRRLYAANYWNENKERLNQIKRKYRKDNRERVARWNAKWAAGWSAKRGGDYYPQYRRNNLEAARRAYQLRRARKRALPASWSARDQRVALAAWQGCCAYCGLSVVDDLFAKIHWDHFIPLVKGGPTTRQNMIPSCDKCNLSKGSRDPKEWLIFKFGVNVAEARIRAIERYLATLHPGGSGPF